MSDSRTTEQAIAATLGESAERTCRMETDELFPVGHAVCSACGKYVSVGNYCPNCGAKVKKLKKRNAKEE